MYILIDIGGTKTRLATSDGSGISDPTIITTPQDFGAALTIIKETADKLTSEPPIAVALGVPGPLNAEHSKILTAPNLPGWQNQPLKTELEKLFNSPVYIANDAALAGLGEATHGAGMGHSIVAFLTISTGIGGSRIVEHQLDTSARGFEPGHQIIVTAGDPCGCGGKGHLEAYVGGNSIKDKHNRKPEDINDQGIWDEVTRYLAVGLNNTAVYWSPHCIVLGGSIMNKIDLTQLSLRFQQDSAIYRHQPLPELKLATLGDTAALHGALTYIHSM